MQLHILGSGGYHPSSTRHTLCSVIPEAGLILDAGTAFFRLEPFLNKKPWHIFLTHAHLDHVIGLTYYWSLCQQKEIGPITIWGSENTLRAVKELLFSEPLFPQIPPYQFACVCPQKALTINAERPECGTIHATPVSLSHPGGSLGYVFQINGKSIAYITDTTLEAMPTYHKAIQNADILLHEAFYPTGYEEMAERTGHVTIHQAAEVAQSVRAKRLVVVHINPLINRDPDQWQAELNEIFPNGIIATDNLVVDI
ncbi:MAG: MBL fold metallo-hydrolase [Thermogutta sp.]